MDKGVQIKLNVTQMYALVDLYRDLIKGGEGENEHDQLLMAHGVALYDRLKDLVRKDQSHYKFRLILTEALGFTQLWNNLRDMALDEYEGTIINTMVKQVDEYVGKLKRRQIG